MGGYKSFSSACSNLFSSSLASTFDLHQHRLSLPIRRHISTASFRCRFATSQRFSPSPQPYLAALSVLQLLNSRMTTAAVTSQMILEDRAMSRASGAARFAMAHAFLDSWFEDQLIPRSETATSMTALPVYDNNAPATSIPPTLSSEEDSRSTFKAASLDTHESTRTSALSPKAKVSVRGLSSRAISWMIRRRT